MWPSLHRRNGLVRERLNLDEPLQRQPRLHHRLAAVAMAHVVDVVLDPRQQAHLFEIRDNLLARDKAVQPRIHAALGVDVRRIVHHVDRRQIVPLAQREVVGIVRRRHLHRAGAEFGAHPFIENHRNLASHQRQAQLFAMQMQVALILRMNSDSHVAQHGFRPRRRHRQKFARILAVGVQ